MTADLLTAAEAVGDAIKAAFPSTVHDEVSAMGINYLLRFHADETVTSVMVMLVGASSVKCSWSNGSRTDKCPLSDPCLLDCVLREVALFIDWAAVNSSKYREHVIDDHRRRPYSVG